VQGNKKQLTTVFHHLIVKASKHPSQTPAEFHVTAEKLGSDWIIKVRGNGDGMEEDRHARLFRFLRRLRGPKVRGGSKSLAIGKRIIEAMAGPVWVELEPGVGSTFCFKLGAVREEGAPSARRSLALAKRNQLRAHRTPLDAKEGFRKVYS